ncbi:hypothetical protein TWF718_001556 [Orbilia javanica]|uniref:Uncharacterized protein n=1 Tax=Orbilia javanica TaxID=47235 RepID=A0AAN8MZ33_9PEZI
MDEGGTFSRYKLVFRRPRVFNAGQYFLVDFSWRKYSTFAGLTTPIKVYISGVETERQLNNPIFELATTSTPPVKGKSLLPYVEGPYGGINIDKFIGQSSFFILIAEDLGLGRQIFLLNELITAQRSRRTKIFLIWIISDTRYGAELINLYNWLMKSKKRSIEERVRDRARSMSLYIKIFGYTQPIHEDARNQNIHMEFSAVRYLPKHPFTPNIQSGTEWQSDAGKLERMNEDDFRFASLSICGPPQTVAGFDILQGDWKPLRLLRAVDKAII